MDGLIFLFTRNFISIISSIFNDCAIRLRMILFWKDVSSMLGLERCLMINDAMLMIILHF